MIQLLQTGSEICSLRNVAAVTTQMAAQFGVYISCCHQAIPAWDLRFMHCAADITLPLCKCTGCRLKKWKKISIHTILLIQPELCFDKRHSLGCTRSSRSVEQGSVSCLLNCKRLLQKNHSMSGCVFRGSSIKLLVLTNRLFLPQHSQQTPHIKKMFFEWYTKTLHTHQKHFQNVIFMSSVCWVVTSVEWLFIFIALFLCCRKIWLNRSHMGCPMLTSNLRSLKE